MTSPSLGEFYRTLGVTWAMARGAQEDSIKDGNLQALYTNHFTYSNADDKEGVNISKKDLTENIMSSQIINIGSQHQITIKSKFASRT